LNKTRIIGFDFFLPLVFYRINNVARTYFNFKVCFISIKKGLNTGYQKTISNQYYDVWDLTIHPNSFTGGLFSNESDNLNYIKIIESYDIENNRVSKEDIDSDKQF
jgi:hypothetical protein